VDTADRCAAPPSPEVAVIRIAATGAEVIRPPLYRQFIYTMVGVAVRCPDGREVPLPSQEGDGKQPGHTEALQLSTDGVWARNSSRQPAFRLWAMQVVGTGDTQAKLQVVDCTSLAIVEEPGRVTGKYTPRGVADSTDPLPARSA